MPLVSGCLRTRGSATLYHLASLSPILQPSRSEDARKPHASDVERKLREDGGAMGGGGLGAG